MRIASQLFAPPPAPPLPVLLAAVATLQATHVAPCPDVLHPVTASIAGWLAAGAAVAHALAHDGAASPPGVVVGQACKQVRYVAHPMSPSQAEIGSAHALSTHWPQSPSPYLPASPAP